MVPNPKFGDNDISDRLFATLEDYELALSERSDGVRANDVRLKLNPEIGRTVWVKRTSILVDKGLLIRKGGARDKETRYFLPEDLAERKAVLNVIVVHGRAAKKRVSPEALAERGLTPDSDLPKVNGLPHRPSDELQTHVACIIEALESLQVHVNAALPLLLDMERDFGRYKKVKEVLLTLKKTSDMVL